MNYTLKSKTVKCKEFSVLDRILFVIGMDKTLYINSNNIKSGNFRFFGIYNNSQIIFDQIIFGSLLYNNQGKLIGEIQDYALRHIFTFTNGNSLVGGNDGNNIFYGIYNFSNNTLLKRYDKLGFNGVYKVLNDKLFLSQNSEKFGVFNFDNELIWECYYKELFSKYESIGAGTTNILQVENKLYVELDKTYCLDIEKGNNESNYNYKFTNSENEFLYGLQFLSMTEFQIATLNTKSNTVNVIDISSEFNTLKVYPDNRIVVDNSLIYFSQNMGDSIAKIGVLDPVSGKILWKYDFEKRSGMIGALKVNGNRIYAHTQDKTLHIFEKQANESI